jgi:hypothetical protein
VVDYRRAPQRWLNLVYSNRLLVIADDPESLSSSSMPSMMARFLSLLDVQDGNTVLQIGTGSGYNAALLCERLGADRVTSIDVDAGLVEAARVALASCGYAPALGVQGRPRKVPQLPGRRSLRSHHRDLLCTPHPAGVGRPARPLRHDRGSADQPPAGRAAPTGGRLPVRRRQQRRLHAPALACPAGSLGACGPPISGSAACGTRARTSSRCWPAGTTDRGRGSGVWRTAATWSSRAVRVAFGTSMKPPSRSGRSGGVRSGHTSG